MSQQRVKAALAKVLAHYEHVGMESVEVRTLLAAFASELAHAGTVFLTSDDDYTWVILGPDRINGATP